MSNFYIANLGFLCNWTDSSLTDEIESELYRIVMQVKGTTHYDRMQGGSFEDLEQEKYNIVIILQIISQIIESVYRWNAKRNYDPFVVMGYHDISIDYDEENKLYVDLRYRVLQDLNTNGEMRVML